MLKLYHNNMSVCAQKVRLTLAEKGLSAEEIHLNLRAGDQQDPEYLKLNPKAYVPTLVHNENVVTESSVICCYIDEAFPENSLMPEAVIDRARARVWIRQPDERIHVACVVLSNTIAFRHQWLARPADELAETIRKTPDFEIRERRKDIIANGIDSFRFKAGVMAYRSLVVEMAETLETSNWIAGETYGLADIALFPYINRAAQLQLDLLWEDLPQIARWFGNFMERQSYRNAIADYDDPAYVSLMKEKGDKHKDAVRATLLSEV